MKNFTLVLVLMFLLGSGCDSADTPEVSKEDCQAYYTEVVEVCRDSFYEGVKVSCHTAFITAGMAHAQKDGKLFKDPNGKVSADTIGDALCASSVRSLRKKRKKAEKQAKKDWGPKCTNFLSKLESSCIAPVAQGIFDKSCSSLLMQVESLKRNKSPESLCEGFAALVKN
jgi:hypothetical protein